jgi:hydroxypyruvate reductase
MSTARLRGDAMSILRTALKAVEAGNAVRAAWPAASRAYKPGDFDRVFLIAAGKAAVEMAAAVEDLLGTKLTAGIVVTKHGHVKRKLIRASIYEAGHPIPDRAGLGAVREIEKLLRELNARDLLIVALSGGASALLSAPVSELTLRDKQRTTQLLLRAGANIRELNAVRKHLSRLKGGKLAALAYPATVVSLILSDVIGDPLDVIASGPTAPDPTTFSDALNVLRKFQLLERAPLRVRGWLEEAKTETPKPGDPIFKNAQYVFVGSNRQALQAARRKAIELGYKTLVLAATLEGEARDLGRMHGAILREILETGNPLKAPACLLSGGEPTVTVHGSGTGGRAQELALGAAIALEGIPDCLLLSAGTDGSDGPTDAAGAWVNGSTVAAGRKEGHDLDDYLARNDAYKFLKSIGALVKTGPTGTNVMDLTICLAG